MKRTPKNDGIMFLRAKIRGLQSEALTINKRIKKETDPNKKNIEWCAKRKIARSMRSHLIVYCLLRWKEYSKIERKVKLLPSAKGIAKVLSQHTYLKLFDDEKVAPHIVNVLLDGNTDLKPLGVTLQESARVLEKEYIVFCVEKLGFKTHRLFSASVGHIIHYDVSTSPILSLLVTKLKVTNKEDDTLIKCLDVTSVVQITTEQIASAVAEGQASARAFESDLSYIQTDTRFKK